MGGEDWTPTVHGVALCCWTLLSNLRTTTNRPSIGEIILDYLYGANFIPWVLENGELSLAGDERGSRSEKYSKFERDSMHPSYREPGGKHGKKHWQPVQLKTDPTLTGRRLRALVLWPQRTGLTNSLSELQSRFIPRTPRREHSSVGFALMKLLSAGLSWGVFDLEFWPREPWEVANWYCFKKLNLWSSVTAAIENEYKF